MSLFGGNKESYKDKKSLVIYFSRADENYSVGYIDKGNTEVIAEYIKDFTGKTVRVFTTHEGSGLGSIPSKVKRLCKGADVLDDGLAIRGASVNGAKGKVENWV